MKDCCICLDVDKLFLFYRRTSLLDNIWHSSWGSWHMAYYEYIRKQFMAKSRIYFRVEMT